MAAIGSAQDQPKVALRAKPTRRTADRYVHRSVCLESAIAEADPGGAEHTDATAGDLAVLLKSSGVPLEA